MLTKESMVEVREGFLAGSDMSQSSFFALDFWRKIEPFVAVYYLLGVVIVGVHSLIAADDDHAISSFRPTKLPCRRL